MAARVKGPRRVEGLQPSDDTPAWTHGTSVAFLPADEAPRDEQERRLHHLKVAFFPILDQDCSKVVTLYEQWHDSNAYAAFAPTWNAFCLDILEVDPAWIDKLCTGLRLLQAQGVTGPITAQEALAAQNQAADVINAQVGRPGGDGSNQYEKNIAINYNDEKDVINCSANMDDNQGNSRTYALRKLAKDRPDLHARCLAGELTAHAAMVDAGFRRKPPSRKQSPLVRLRALWIQLSPEEQALFLQEITAVLSGSL